MSTQTDTTALFRQTEGGVKFAPRQIVFAQGDPGSSMFAVQEGAIDITVNGVTVETVGPGGIFGELALLDNGPRSSTATASTESMLVEVDQAKLMLMIRQTPFFAMYVMRLLARRLRATDKLIHSQETP